MPLGTDDGTSIPLQERSRRDEFVSKPTQQDLVKLYYRIGEVSQIVGVQPHVLRYWESEFRTIRPQKSSKGQRVYSRKDVEKLLRVKDLLKNQGFTIAGARKQLSRRGSDEPERATEQGNAQVRNADVELRAEGRAVQTALTAAQPVMRTTSNPASVGPTQRHQAKALRRSLVQLRNDILGMLEELDAYGRPEVSRRK